MKKLLSFLSSIHPMSPGLEDHLESILQIRHIRKKEFLLEIGQVSRYISFIEKGLFRCYYLEETKQVCSWFMKEGDVIASVGSFYRQQPSYECIQALEDSRVYFITFDQLQHIYRDYPEFNFTGRVLTEKYYQLADERLYSLKMKTASKRYQYLLDHYPDLMRRVPKAHLASYLAITPETLSRIMGYPR